MKGFFVYILYSERLGRYYAGSTGNLEDRIRRHNNGESKATKRGIPWQLLYYKEMGTCSAARQEERRIKKRGCYRYLVARGMV